MGFGCSKPFHSALHDQTAYIPRFVLSPHNSYLSKRCIANPHLSTIQHHMVPLVYELCLHAGGIGTMVRLRQSEAAHPFACCELRQVLPLLFLTTIPVDRVHY